MGTTGVDDNVKASVLPLPDRFSEVEAAYHAILITDPHRIDALLGLGQCARSRGDRSTAIAQFKMAAAADPDNPWPQIEIATEHREHGRVDDAEARYKTALESNPGHSQALFGLGLCARMRGNHAAAMERFQAASAADARNPWPQIEIALEYRNQGRLDDAEAAYSVILAVDPDQLNALLGLGQCARARGDRSAAMARFQVATVAHPSSPWPQIEIATEYCERGQVDDAEAIYKAALAKNPGHSQALFGLGQCARLRGDRATAIEFFQAAAEKDAINPWPKIEIALEHRHQGQFDEAEATYNAILAQHPDQINALLGLGLCARSRGDRATAMARFQIAATAHPSSPWPKSEIAREHIVQGDLEDASATYREMCAVDRNQIDALLGLGLCARLQGDRSNAMSLFRAAAASHPDNPWPQIEIATEHREQGKVGLAEATYRTALDISPGHSQALLGLGQCARLRGDRTVAMDRFEEAARTDPSSSWPHIEIAKEYRDQGHFETSINTLRGILSRNKMDINCWMSIGVTYRQKGDPETALETFKHAQAIDGHIPDILCEIALTERALGRPHLCQQALEMALSIDRHHSLAVIGLAHLAILEYEFDRAESSLRQAIRFRPNIAALRITLAQVLSELGHDHEALLILDDHEHLFGETAEVLTQRADILYLMGAYDAAEKLLQNCMNRNPWNFNTWLQKLRLDWIINGRDSVVLQLKSVPAYTTDEAARLAQLTGQIHEDASNLNEAIFYYEKALSLNPFDIGIHQDLARAYLLDLNIDGCRQHLKSIIGMDLSSIYLQKRSRNISQSHLGQLVDEFALDKTELAALIPLRAHSPRDRIPLLLESIRRAPDYTAGACLLLLAFNELDNNDNTQPIMHDSGTAIPKIILQYWDTPEIPDELRNLSRTWTEKNPRFRHIIFDHGSAQSFISEHFERDVLLAYMRATEPAQKVDIFRLAFLFAEGGYYTDMDDRCLEPLDAFVPERSRFVCYRESFGTIGNNFLAVAPQSAIIGRALSLAVTAVNRGDNDILWLSTGPGVLTRSFAQILSESPFHWSSWLQTITILSWPSFSRSVLAHCRLRYKKTRRHWSHTALGKRRAYGEAIALTE